MEHIHCITTFGAVANGGAPSTKAINAAIEAAEQAGGGRVIVPPGEFLSGTVVLKSNVTLELSPGAVLRAAPDKSEYPDWQFRALHPPHLHSKKPFYRYFIIAEECSNVTICGGGTIDGNVSAFTPGWESYPAYTWTDPREGPFIPMIEIASCRDVRIHDVTITNSPGWDCHLVMCDRVWIDRVHLHNYVYAGGTDGFDIDGCRDVMIANCRIETGDDCIVLKSFPNTRSCERITITNCILKTMCSAVKIGTETWHDFRQITFSNSVVYESSRAFQITSFDGGTIEDINVSDLVVDTNCGNPFNRPVMIDLGPRPKGFVPGLDPADQPEPGPVRGVSIENVSLRTDGRILLHAMDGRTLEDISLSNIRVSMPWIDDPQALPDGADPLQGCAASADLRRARAVVVAKNVARLRLDGITVRWPDGPPPESFQPKRKKGRVVRDPSTESSPPFAVLWGKGLIDGRIALGESQAYGDQPDRAIVRDSSVDLVE